MNLQLESIRECLDGVVPAAISTCAPDGTPNVTFLSQVEYVDWQHVALSYQFFNKTRQNILANPHARVLVIDPMTAATYRLHIQYLRTETEGPLFERMKAKLAGIASHSGMAGVFRLLGADICKVLSIETISGCTLPPPPARNRLAMLRGSAERLRTCCDLDSLFTTALSCLEELFAIRHSMLLMHDAASGRLYTVGSRGYAESGIGSEIRLGEGVIGVAARERTPIRIGHMTSEYRYGQAIRSQAEQSGMKSMLETQIPFPGLRESRSQLAVPILSHDQCLGVVFTESGEDLRFTYDDEDAMVALATQIGTSMSLLQESEATPAPTTRPAPETAVGSGKPIVVKHYTEDDSIFFDDGYVIKGVAGNILWVLLRDFADKNRTCFSNRELRLDPRVKLPDVSDNLEARLVLLRRRLDERCAGVKLDRPERGRILITVTHPLKLVEIHASRDAYA